MELLWLVPLLPLLAAGINGACGQKMGKGLTTTLAVGSVWASFAIALVVVLGHSVGGSTNNFPTDQAPFYWFDAGAFRLKIGLLLDPLSSVMMLIITGVGALIHTYSIGYMAEDTGYNRYFCHLNLFTFSMLMLVLGDSFLVLFVGWELVGLCSYLLIGFWYDRESATNAGRKAFIVNRVGDWAFIIGVILTFAVFLPRLGAGDGLRFQSVFGYLATHANHPAALTGSLTLIPVIALLLFIGATGKSAQLPILYIWLPDAMEGPTPVSALIHAATMVTAGVYMVARCHDLFLLSPAVMGIVAWVGVLTAFVAATVAVAQTDIKRVLAYSTISQLGYMFVGAGVGAFSFSIFHLMTHAFFKALLFLAAGAVIHALHNEQDMRRMGGLMRRIPQIGVLMGVGVLAISGIPPLAGFWSKDAILGSAACASPAIWAIGVMTAFLTAFYMGRLWMMTFSGEEHWAGGHGHGGDDIHPTSGSMLAPMWVLALLSVVGGVGAMFLPHYLAPVFADMPVPDTQPFLPNAVLMAISIVAAVGGILTAWVAYRASNAEPRPWMQRSPGLYTFLLNAWNIDRTAHAVFGRCGTAAAEAAYEDLEVGVIDRGVVSGVAAAVSWVSRELRIVQSGVVSDYALAMALGAACVVVYFLLR